jgi:hypothetical protein
MYHHHHLHNFAQKYLDVILTKKGTVEELNDVCEILMEKSACSTVRDHTVAIQKSYSGLLDKTQGKWALN